MIWQVWHISMVLPNGGKAKIITFRGQHTIRTALRCWIGFSVAPAVNVKSHPYLALQNEPWQFNWSALLQYRFA